jgi:predicted DNA-binding protein (UPF0251 family)
MAHEAKTVVLTEKELGAFRLDDPATIELISRAERSVEADRQLTIRQALKKYKKAVFWALILSTALVMEGYDVVVVSRKHDCFAWQRCSAHTLQTDDLLHWKACVMRC